MTANAKKAQEYYMYFKVFWQRQAENLPSRCARRLLVQLLRPVVPKCARLQRLRRAAGCFGEKGPTPNPGRGLRFPASRLHNRHCPHPHQKRRCTKPRPNGLQQNGRARAKNTSPAVVVVVLGSFAPAGATRACAALDLRPGSPGGHNLWDRRPARLIPSCSPPAGPP